MEKYSRFFSTIIMSIALFLSCSSDDSGDGDGGGCDEQPTCWPYD